MLYDLADSFFEMPAIVVGIKNKVWTHTPSGKPHRLDAVREIWIKLGLIDERGALTLSGMSVVEDGLPLFEYYLNTLFEMLDADHGAPPYHKIDHSQDVEILRQLALSNFHQKYISPFFWEALGFVDETGLLLDIAGGIGHYSKDWVYAHEQRTALILDNSDLEPEDKDARCTFTFTDVIKDGTWGNIHEGKATVALLSEFLCTKSPEDRHRIIVNAKKTLAPRGSIVVNERHPNSVLNWRLAVLTDHGRVMSSRDIAELMTSNGMTQTHAWCSSSHQATRWKL